MERTDRSIYPELLMDTLVVIRHALYGNLDPFLRQHNDVYRQSSIESSLEHLDDFHEQIYLELEITVTVDAGKSYVLAAHMLEGDWPLAMK